MRILSEVSHFMVELTGATRESLQISITGGEPLIEPNLEKILSSWQDIAETVTICTSGGVMVSPSVWHSLHDHGLSVVRLSMHTTSDHIGKTIFGPTYSLDTVLKNAQVIKASGIDLHINFLATSLSLPGWHDVVEMCEELEVSHLRILGLSKQGHAEAEWSSLSLQEDVILRTILEIATAVESRGLTMEIAGFQNLTACCHSDDSGRCLGGKSFFHINADGNVFPCPSVKSIPSQRLGHVSDGLCLIRRSRFLWPVETCNAQAMLSCG
jgi:MoaA/NifB/PqqE/SkfB family radical SAM enzyme